MKQHATYRTKHIFNHDHNIMNTIADCCCKISKMLLTQHIHIHGVLCEYSLKYYYSCRHLATVYMHAHTCAHIRCCIFLFRLHQNTGIFHTPLAAFICIKTLHLIHFITDSHYFNVHSQSKMMLSFKLHIFIYDIQAISHE